MNLLFFLLKLEHRSFAMDIESYYGYTTHFSKVLGSGTAHCQLTSGITERGNVDCIKGKGNGGHKYENMSLGQSLTSSFEELRQLIVFWFLVHGGDDNYV